MTSNHSGGLTTAEAQALQAQHGKNELSSQKKEGFIGKAFHIITQPMFLLLIIAAAIYFILGEPVTGWSCLSLSRA